VDGEIRVTWHPDRGQRQELHLDFTDAAHPKAVTDLLVEGWPLLASLDQRTGPRGPWVLTSEQFAEQAQFQYWAYVDEHGERPSDEEMAYRLFVSTSTFGRRKRDYVKKGGVWPPPRLVQRL
jgi:hypothetical protein